MRIAGLIIAALLLGGCANSGYFANRLNDGADIITLSVGAGVGGKISVGPIYINTFGVMHRDLVGLRYGDFVSSPSDSEDSEIGSWFGWGESFHTRTELQKQRNIAPEFFFTDIPFLMTRKRGKIVDPLTLECVLGLGPSVRFGISPLEFIDFIVGWTTFDLSKDDLPLTPKTEDSKEKKPKAGNTAGTHVGGGGLIPPTSSSERS